MGDKRNKKQNKINALTVPKEINENNYNKCILNKLKKVLDKKHAKDRDVILLMQEEKFKKITSSIRPHFSDRVAEVGPTPNHFITFCLQDVYNTWYQPIGTMFWRRGFQVAKDPESGFIHVKHVVYSIVTVIKALQGIGINVICTVSHPTKRMSKIVNYLVQAKEYQINHHASNELVYKVNEQVIVHLYDAVELLRDLRDTFAYKDIIFEENGIIHKASMDHIEIWSSLIDQQENRNITIDTHIKPQMKYRHNFKYVIDLFSGTVATSIENEVMLGNLHKEFLSTAKFILLFDKLFDSMNGSFNQEKKPYRRPLEFNGPHFDLWFNAIPILESMHFSGPWRDSHNLDLLHTQQFNRWISTIKGMARIFYILAEKDYKLLRTRCFNSEILTQYVEKIAMQNNINLPNKSSEPKTIMMLNKDIEAMSLEPMIGSTVIMLPCEK